MNAPQSELAKRLSIAFQAAISAAQRNDGPCLHLAQQEAQAILEGIDALQQRLDQVLEPEAPAA